MSKGQVIKNALKRSKKTQSDLAAEMGEARRETINQRLARNDVDDDMVDAVSRLTGMGVNVLWEELNSTEDEPDDVQSLREENIKLKAEKESLEKEIIWLRSLVERLPGSK